MEDLNITLFDKADIEGLAKIENECFSYPFKEKDFLDLYESEISNVLVAKIGKDIVGYVSFTLIIDECQIINFAVSSPYRRRGIGRKIMDALLLHGREKGITKYFLEVRVSNKSAIALYEGFGFYAVGTSRGHFKAPLEDALLMNLEL
ncbi:MAG: ribosomal protein S18-alanine N-acetyltransferase [Clostridia bacterium]|nr:ribosomal protein S18-alanine N-acetyltransferase [Clostridia bacterium]